MHEIDKVLALPIPVQIGGQEYKLSLNKKRLQGEFAVWLKAKHRQTLLSSLEGLPDNVVATAMMKFKDESLASEDVEIVHPDGRKQTVKVPRFGLGGSAGQQAMATAEGQAFFLALLLRQHQPKLSLADVERMIEDHPADVGLAIGEVIEAGKSTPSTPAKE